MMDWRSWTRLSLTRYTEISNFQIQLTYRAIEWHVCIRFVHLLNNMLHVDMAFLVYFQVRIIIILEIFTKHGRHHIQCDGYGWICSFQTCFFSIILKLFNKISTNSWIFESNSANQWQLNQIQDYFFFPK